MKKIYFLRCLIFSIIAIILAVCNPSTPKQSRIEPIEGFSDASLAAFSNLIDNSGSHFLWEVPSKSTKIYLLGSIHFGTEDLYPLPEIIMEKYNSCDYLVGEANIIDLDMVKLGELMKKVDNPLIKDLLKPENAMNIFKSFDREALRKMAEYANWGIDMHLQKKAKDDGKEILELEGLLFQLELLAQLGSDKFSFEELNRYFQDIDGVNLFLKEMDKIITSWKGGDLGTMAMLMEEGLGYSSESKNFYDLLLTTRNKGMADKIEGYLTTDKSYLIVVGAGHLVGKNSIQDFLAAKGFMSKQL